jgi:hypothetical protein
MPNLYISMTAKKCLKIPKGESEAVRTNNEMAKRKKYKMTNMVYRTLHNKRTHLTSRVNAGAYEQ